MEKYSRSQLQPRQQKSLIKAIEALGKSAERNTAMARRDAEDLKRFIHIMRALSFITPNERNYYLKAIDDVMEAAAPKHDDTLYGAIRQSGAKV